jgi:hypothetical protein
VSALALLLLLHGTAVARQKPSLPEADRVRIAEAFRLGRALEGRVWRSWREAPFALLLVTPEHEFLMRHPSPSKDFESAGFDPLLQSEVYYRKRTFGTHLLATFPAVGGVPTVVIGQAENTDKKSSTPWVVTVLHEHFHQLQSSQPRYYKEVDSLNLSRGDRTGMWMLNYAFPYSSPEVARRFGELCRLLSEALRARPGREFDARLAAYLDARRAFAATLEPDDYRYFSFQVWQEGVARYTEYRVARLAAEAYRPSRQFRALKDYKPFKQVADEIMGGITKELETLRLEDYRRVAFYPLGAGEALLLDRAKPGWKDRYLSEKFYVEKYFAPSPRAKGKRAG